MNPQQAQHCGRFIGRKELIAHLSGHKLPKWKAIKAKCFECTGGYADGAFDCRIPTCPLYPFMPYRDYDGGVGRGASTGSSARTIKLPKGPNDHSKNIQ